jgi:hypothetical protein
MLDLIGFKSLTLQFNTDREGNITGLSPPLEPAVGPIVRSLPTLAPRPPHSRPERQAEQRIDREPRPPRGPRSCEPLQAGLRHRAYIWPTCRNPRSAVLPVVSPFLMAVASRRSDRVVVVATRRFLPPPSVHAANPLPQNVSEFISSKALGLRKQSFDPERRASNSGSTTWRPLSYSLKVRLFPLMRHVTSDDGLDRSGPHRMLARHIRTFVLTALLAAGPYVPAWSGDVAVANPEATATVAQLGSMPGQRIAAKAIHRLKARRATRRWALRLAARNSYYGSYRLVGPSLILGARF